MEVWRIAAVLFVFGLPCLIPVVWTDPILNSCPSGDVQGLIVADDTNPCVFHTCLDSSVYLPAESICSNGKRVPPYFVGMGDPCFGEAAPECMGVGSVITTEEPPPTVPIEISRYYGVNIFDGHQIPGITTMSDCLLLCSESAPCWGVDFANDTNACFFHFEDTECTRMYELETSIHYRIRNGCGQTTGSSTTTAETASSDSTSASSTSDSTSEVTTRPADISSTATTADDVGDVSDSSPTFDPNSGTGGSDVTTDATASSTSNDVSGTTPGHIATDEPSTVFTATSSTSTTASTATSQPPLQKAGFPCSVANYNIPGGDVTITGISLDECLDSCLANHDCMACDYNKDNKGCWFHDYRTYTSAMSPAPGVYHYKKTPCSAAFSEYKEGIYSFHMSMGEKLCDSCELEDCLVMCRSDTECEAVSYNDATNQCFMHNSSTSCNPPQFLALQSIFRKVLCSDVKESEDTQANFGNIKYSGPSTSMVPPGWLNYIGAAVHGGQLEGRSVTADQCLGRCWQHQQRCGSVNYLSDSGSCYFLDDEATCNSIKAVSAAFHVKRYECYNDTMGDPYPSPVGRRVSL